MGNFSEQLQNTQPLIYMSLNKNSVYCVMPRSSKPPDTCKWGGPKWPGIQQFSQFLLLKYTRNKVIIHQALTKSSPKISTTNPAVLRSFSFKGSGPSVRETRIKNTDLILKNHFPVDTIFGVTSYKWRKKKDTSNMLGRPSWKDRTRSNQRMTQRVNSLRAMRKTYQLLGLIMRYIQQIDSKLHILTSSVICYWTDARQLGIYLFYIIKN